MLIQKMFERDIDRNINGVVKVAQTDEKAVCQELSEYVVTNELAGHFATFFDAYNAALDVPTDKIGVWISGFFGSGKSHFLKMLSYLLTNKVVEGRPAIDYFDGKFADQMTDARVRRCASVPTESILFNVDNKAVGAKDAGVLKRTFARVFYDHLGFYGEDLRLARLERFIDEKGLTADFRAAFEDINGEPWLDARAEYDFFSDDLVDALEQAGVMSRAEAERWVSDPNGQDISLEALTDQIRDYANAQAEAHGGQFRLLFMVDEIGQFIGGDSNLMLNLQTIVEELGSKCAGRVWVVVTSQEAIDEVTRVVGQDYSKIQGRFNTRLSLSSSSADEVIKRRILAKNEDADGVLRAQYATSAAVLKNLFTFEGSTADLIGYADADDYVETFPFAGYQFRLMQNVMGEIRKHGSSGKHLSSGERSMLSGFQEAAQRVEGGDEHTLVPFWMFYDTVQTFLEGYIRRVIDRAAGAAEKGDQGLELDDVNVLKLLFLLKWDKDVKTCVDNIVTLMTGDVHADRLALRERVQGSLDRLVQQNYVSRNGDTYQFLTDDEQEIARQISRQDPDPARIRQKIGDLFFSDVFAMGKLPVGENSFAIERWVDQTRVGQAGGLVLRVMTVLADEAELDRTALLMQSSKTPEAIVVLSDEAGYYEPLREALQIDSFIKTQNVANLPVTLQDIIRSKNQQKVVLEKRAAALIEEAVRRGAYYAAGEEVRLAPGQSAKKLVEETVSRLVGNVYPKLDLIEKSYQSDADLSTILNGGTQTLEEGQQPNATAVAAVDAYLETQQRLMHKPTMAEVQTTFQAAPYGWRQIDVAACMAELLAQNRAKATYAGKTLELGSAKLVECLRKLNASASCTIERRTHVSEGVRARARKAVVEFCRASDVPSSEEALAARATELLEQRADELRDRLEKDYARAGYPGRGVVERAHKLASGLLAVGADPADLLPAIKDAYDDLLDAAEDLEPVDAFWQGQVTLWDSSRDLLGRLTPEAEYLEADAEATRALARIREVLGMDAPYKRIKELGDCCQTLRKAYDALLKAKRLALLDLVEEMYADIRGYAESKGVSNPDIAKRELERRNAVNASTSLTKLDAIQVSLNNDQKTFYSRIDDEVARREASKPQATRIEPAAGTPGHIKAPAAPVPQAQDTAPTATPQPQAPKPPRVRTLPHATACPPQRLTSAADVDAYCARLRERLIAALKDADPVQIN